MRFEIFMAAENFVVAFWVVTSRSLVGDY